MTELKRWGLCTVRVYTSSLLSPGSHGKSRRLTLRIGFFSGSLNGLGPGQIVRVHLLAVECSLGKPAYPAWLMSEHLCSEVRRIGQIEKKAWWRALMKSATKAQREKQDRQSRLPASPRVSGVIAHFRFLIKKWKERRATLGITIKDAEMKKSWKMEESKGGTDHLTAICSPWLVSWPEQGVYHCLADKNHRCYWLDVKTCSDAPATSLRC